MDAEISIIIPVFNVEKYIGICLESVINQTFRNLEIILVNDGSTDGSGKICDEYAARDSRIRVIHQENKGVSAARNEGLRLSSGKYVGFVDGDDWIDDDMLSFLLEMADAYDADIATCGYYVNNKADPDLDLECETKIISQEKSIRMSLELKEFCFDSGVFNKIFRSKILKENGIEFEDEIAIGEDMLYLCKCIMSSGKIVYSPIPKYHVFTNSMSATRRPFNSKKASLVRAHEKMEEIVSPKYPQLVPAIRKRSVLSSYRLLCEANVNKSFNEAEAIKILQNDIKKNITYALKCADVSLKNKLGLVLIVANLTLYRHANFLYEAALRLFNYKL